MSLAALLSDTITLVHVTYDSVDAYGDAQAGTTTSEVVPARLEAMSSDELIRDRDVIVADWRVFLPPDVTVGPFDQIQSAGRTFDVWGDPIRRHSPRGTHHLEVRLRRVS